MEDDLVFVENTDLDNGNKKQNENEIIISLLKENNDLIKKLIKISLKTDVEIFFLPENSPWTFNIEIPVKNMESYPNNVKNNITNFVTRALSLMTEENQIKCRDGNPKQRQLLVKYVNKLYNIEINSKIFNIN